MYWRWQLYIPTIETGILKISLLKAVGRVEVSQIIFWDRNSENVMDKSAAIKNYKEAKVVKEMGNTQAKRWRTNDGKWWTIKHDS